VKHIVKGVEPDNFTVWKDGANRTYSNLRNPLKNDLKDALLLEQGYICCYCESKITSNDSHIEHLDPQCNNNGNGLDFTNLLCSCQKQLSAGEPRHCGNSKANETIIIHPLQINCESRFTYNGNGTIEATDTASQKTLEYLKLDIDKLNDLRNKAIEPFLIDPITLEELSEDDVKIFANDYLKIENGKYNEFYTTIKYLFG